MSAPLGPKSAETGDRGDGQLESQRLPSGPQATRAIVHVDMDAFFASVEQRDEPALRGKPVLVGRVHRGVVCAASYEARSFGCHSAMSMAQALKRCPHAVVMAPRFAAYQRASQAAFAIFARFTPLIEGLSLDEAFLDVTGSQALLGPAALQAANIREAIRTELGLPCSAGVAPSKFVAKLASEWAKPNGLSVVEAPDVAARLARLPIGRMYGVGPRLAERLASCGVRSFADLRAIDPAKVCLWTGKDEAERLVRLAWGQDERPVVAGRTAKSAGAEETLAEDCSVAEELLPRLLEQALQIASRLARQGLYAGGVRLKLKSADFVLTSRQMTFGRAERAPDVLYRAAKRLLLSAPLPRDGVRLVGTAAIALTDRGPEKELFVPEDGRKQEAIEAVRLAIETKFGRGQLTRAAVLGRRAPRR